ncbi:TonB-dependent receptor [Chitinophaga horti]|uniref:TonB-dependent receptor n=1 Tax=Chitinophaga horti TaxID=2920382 RepID=A0ABY6J217_9BACT|nr:TonB-dependent receptor [Chitinophaga horti]UYQ92396.1 TonB-dependent receptor [Chitinophaga horti]
MQKKFYAFLSGGLLLLMQGAAAQDTTQTNLLNTVVVTATKFAKKQGETGKVVTVISREQIDRSRGKSVAQLLNEQVGMVIAGANSNPGKNKEIYFRGATTNYTTILIDGIPINDASGLTGSNIDLRFIPTDQIERIEILRGTQSTMYGADAIAGVINVITRKGGDKAVSVSGDLNWGSNRTVKGTVGANGRTENIDYNLSFTHLETDGISEAEDTLNTGKFDRDGYKQDAFMANIGIHASEKLTLRPFLMYSKFKSDYDGGSFTDGGNKTNSEFLHTGISGVYTLDKGMIQANYGFQKVNRAETSSFGVSNYDGRNWIGDIFGNYNVTDWMQVLAGVELRKSQLLDTSLSTPNPDMHNTSPYAALFFRNLGGFNLELGGRYTLHNTYGNNFTYTINPSYLIAEKVKVFATLATGFKAPTLTNLYGQWGSNPNLEPEEARTYEGGAEVSVWNNKLDLRGVVFKRDIKNVIFYNNLGEYVNLNEQNDKGFELEATVKPAKSLQINAYYAFVEGSTNTVSSTGKDSLYSDVLARRPKHSGGINIGYEICPHLFISSNVRFNGEKNDLRFDPVTYASSPVMVKEFTLWDMYVEYRYSKKGRLYANFNNITDTKYNEIYGYGTLGFNVMAGISFNF